VDSLFSNAPEVPEPNGGTEPNMPIMADHFLTDMPESGTPAPVQTQTAPAAPAAPTPKPVDYEKRYKDLQSYTDKKLAEMKRERQNEQQRYQELMALEQHIKANPDLINILEASLTGKPIQATPHPVSQVQVPPKPVDFDPTEIYDPSTPSGQWYGALQKAQQLELVSSITSEVDKRFQALEEKQQALKQQELQRLQAMEVKQKFDQFFQARNLELEERDEFLEFVQRGPQKQPTLDDLYLWYRAMKGTPSQGTPDVDIDSRIAQARKDAPPSITSVGSKAADQLTEDQAFSQLLMQGGRKKWNFK
jgi:hypothetical protein